jgi:hypothetical protein
VCGLRIGAVRADGHDLLGRDLGDVDRVVGLEGAPVGLAIGLRELLGHLRGRRIGELSAGHDR